MTPRTIMHANSYEAIPPVDPKTTIILGTNMLAICQTLCSKHIRRHDRAFQSGRRDYLEQKQGDIVEIST
jgi:hypothetical protein